MKNFLDEFNNKLEMVEERISELEGKSREIFQTEEQRGKKKLEKNQQSPV